MIGRVIFLTHGDVDVDAHILVQEWRLNDTGRRRHNAFAQDPVLNEVTAVYSSSERKAREGAQPVAKRFGLEHQIHEGLCENDRSATGYLPESEFWPVVEAFFAKPDVSTRGWETARDAQARVLKTVHCVVAEEEAGDVLMVSHGGVSTLLRCALLRKEISRDEGQPHANGDCWFSFDRAMQGAPSDWKVI